MKSEIITVTVLRNVKHSDAHECVVDKTGARIWVDFYVDGKMNLPRDELIGKTYTIRANPFIVIAHDIEEMKEAKG